MWHGSPRAQRGWRGAGRRRLRRKTVRAAEHGAGPTFGTSAAQSPFSPLNSGVSQTASQALVLPAVIGALGCLVFVVGLGFF